MHKKLRKLTIGFFIHSFIHSYLFNDKTLTERNSTVGLGEEKIDT